jgi:hypothetical protein
VFAVPGRDDILHRIDLETGEENWVADLENTPASGYNTIEVVDGMVAVDVDGTAEAFSSSDGEVL